MSESDKKAAQDKMVEAVLKAKAEKAAKKAESKKEQHASSQHAPKFAGNAGMKGHSKAHTPRMMSRAKKG